MKKRWGFDITNKFRMNATVSYVNLFSTATCFGRLQASGIPRNFFRGGGGGSTNSVEDRGQRERGSGVVAPLVRGSGGGCNLVQEISFHIVKFS